MATSMFKLIGPTGATYEITDDGAGGVTVSLDGTATAGVEEQAAITSLTDSSGGTANNTVAEITNAANAGSADVGPTADAIADLAAKVNAILAALRAANIIAT